VTAPVLPPPCWDLFDATLETVRDGLAVVRFVGKAEHANPYGNVQGGLLAAMIDNCLGPAVLSVAPDRPSTTVEMTVNFLSPMRPGDVVLGEATVLRHGRTTAYVETTLRRPDGTLVARSSATNVFLDGK
jgi:uncharacterized protein (TIGR00369 family)